MVGRALTSFKTELARVKAEFARVEAKAGKPDADDEQHLARWAIDDRAEEVWKTIQIHAFGPTSCGANRALDPVEAFVVSVLLARRAADNSDNVYRSRSARRLARSALAPPQASRVRRWSPTPAAVYRRAPSTRGSFSDMAFARLCPIDATDTQHGNGTFFETSLAEHVLCTHVNLP